MIVEVLQVVVLGGARVVHGRVVAERHQLDGLEPEHAEGLRPAAVVADAHADPAAEGVEGGEAEVADLEVALLQVLEGEVRLVLAMPGG